MKKVLLIEDNQTVFEIYKQKLSTSFEVAWASEGVEGYGKAVTWQPDVILLDLILPGKESGVGTLNRLKSDDSTKDIPVIVLSNLSNQKELVLQNGAADYLVKSEVTLDEIENSINAHIL